MSAATPTRGGLLAGIGVRILGAVPLVIVWILLWGNLSVANVVSGVVVAVGVNLAFPLPVPSERVRLRPLAALWLLLRLFYDLVIASLSVSLLALRPHAQHDGALIAVRLCTESDLLMTITAELVSLVPGSLVLDIDRDGATLFVHVLDASRAGAVERSRAEVLATQARVVRAFGSTTERRLLKQVQS